MSNFYKLFGVRFSFSHDNLVLSRNVKIKFKREFSSFSSENVKDNKNTAAYQPIADFYSGKSVFITGATGFLGKVFLEKLLYSCNKLDKIYILVREKKGKNVNKRLEDMFANPLFSRLKKKNPNFLKQVVPVIGDMRQLNLGLSPIDEQTLIDKVSVVYHAAATVRFNEPLPVAMNINFEGTQKILELSRRMKNIEALLYISTAFTQTQRKVLVETVYPPPAKVEDVYKFCEEYGHDTGETLKFLSDHEKPNSYTFTKALSEAYIASHKGDVPTVIIRPSIVAAIKDEPLKGWVDNWMGGTPYLYSAAKGWNRFNLGSSSHAIDFVPVDYVSNLSIIAGARAKRSNEVQVYNCTSSSDNPITMTDTLKYFSEEMILRGENDLPYPSFIFVKSKVTLTIGTFIFQTTPAYIADLWLKITGKEPRYVKMISQVLDMRSAYDFVSSKPWLMRAERARELFSSLSPQDKQTFPCDPTQIRWSEYCRNYYRGVQRYLKPT